MNLKVPTSPAPSSRNNERADMTGRAPDGLDELGTNCTLTIEADIDVAKYPLSTTMEAVRRGARRAFNLDDNERRGESQVKSGLASAVMCDYGRYAGDGRIDLLAEKLATLLFERRYRSRVGSRFEYGNGSRHRA